MYISSPFENWSCLLTHDLNMLHKMKTSTLLIIVLTSHMSFSQENNADKAATEQLAAHPAQVPTHPDETKNLPADNVVPDGVSPPIRHPLDPLNAGISILCFFFQYLFSSLFYLLCKMSLI